MREEKGKEIGEGVEGRRERGEGRGEREERDKSDILK